MKRPETWGYVSWGATPVSTAGTRKISDCDACAPPGQPAHASIVKRAVPERNRHLRSEEHTSELQSLMRISYAVFCLKKKTHRTITYNPTHTQHTKYANNN